MRRPGGLAGLVLALLAVALGCADRGARELGQRRAVLGREVAGLRQLAAQLEREEPVVAPEDVAVAIDDSLVRELIAAQLPFETDVDRFRVRLTGVEVRFHGSAVVELRGQARLRDRPEIESSLSALGAIEDITIDATTGMLRARIAVDEITIQQAAGFEAWLSERGLDEIALTIRSQLVSLLPPLEIPVQVQQRLELPAVTTGPLRIRGATLPLRATVRRVVAGRGKLWIGVHIQPGEVGRLDDVPTPSPASSVGEPKPEANGR